MAVIVRNLPTVSMLNVIFGQLACICSMPTLSFNVNDSYPSLMFTLWVYL